MTDSAVTASTAALIASWGPLALPGACVYARRGRCVGDVRFYACGWRCVGHLR